PPTTAPPTTAPPTTAPPTTAPPTTAPPTLVPSEPPSSQFDACGALQRAASDTTVVLPDGVWSIGDCRVQGGGRSGVTVRSGFPSSPTGASGSARTPPVLVGALACSDCDGWTFDGVSVRGNGALADPGYVVNMTRGNGWRWTNCDLSNGVDPSGRRYGVRGVFGTWEAARNWQVDNCRIHSNGSSRPTVPQNNFDHLVYINGFNTAVSANAKLGPGNVFENNRWGAPIKVGFGVSASNMPVGVRGVRVFDNTLRANSSPDGNCGILVAGDSLGTVLEGNRIDCTDLPDATTLNPILLWAWPAGTTVHIERNTIIGSGGSGVPTSCGARTGSTAYDRSILIQQWLINWWITVNSNGCQFQGVTTIGNKSVD
ncbi:MAG: hypothetical protein FJW94_11515, partial [Actinobacteria bacterium]|nr:hypothetical protein [Actinomycetota bacterium]